MNQEQKNHLSQFYVQESENATEADFSTDFESLDLEEMKFAEELGLFRFKKIHINGVKGILFYREQKVRDILEEHNFDLYIEKSFYRLSVFFDILDESVEAETEIARSDFSEQRTSQRFSDFLYKKIPNFLQYKANYFQKPVKDTIKRSPGVASLVGRDELKLDSWLRIFGGYIEANGYQVVEENRVWEKTYPVK